MTPHVLIDPLVPYHRNFGHFLHQQVPIVHAGLQQLGLLTRRDVRLYCSSPNCQLLDLLTDLPVLPKDQAPAGASRIDSRQFDWVTDRPLARPQPPLGPLHQYLQPRLPPPKLQHILLVMRVGANRQWGDPAGLIRNLSRLGPPVIPADFTRLERSRQRLLVRQARLVVGVHGAGLTNILFAPPGGALLEVRPCNCGLGHIAFQWMAEQLKLNYRLLYGLPAPWLTPEQHARLAAATIGQRWRLYTRDPTIYRAIVDPPIIDVDLAQLTDTAAELLRMSKAT